MKKILAVLSLDLSFEIWYWAAGLLSVFLLSPLLVVRDSILRVLIMCFVYIAKSIIAIFLTYFFNRKMVIAKENLSFVKNWNLAIFIISTVLITYSALFQTNSLILLLSVIINVIVIYFFNNFMFNKYFGNKGK